MRSSRDVGPPESAPIERGEPGWSCTTDVVQHMLYSCQMSIRDDVVRATLRVIATDGFKAVTIRRVAAEVNRSTTAVTHYFTDRDALLRETVRDALTERRSAADGIINDSEDQVWAFLEWSIDADHDGVWSAVVAASAAGIEPEIVEEARRFDEWWTDRLCRLLEGRCAENIDPRLLAEAIGVAVDGFVLGLGISDTNTSERHRLLHILVNPLLTSVPSTTSRSERPHRSPS